MRQPMPWDWNRGIALRRLIEYDHAHKKIEPERKKKGKTQFITPLHEKKRRCRSVIRALALTGRRDIAAGKKSTQFSKRPPQCHPQFSGMHVNFYSVLTYRVLLSLVEFMDEGEHPFLTP